MHLQKIILEIEVDILKLNSTVYVVRFGGKLHAVNRCKQL